MTLNKSGLAHAKTLLQDGKLDSSGSWSFSAEDGNAMLGADGKDWNNYCQYFLGEDMSVAEGTKDRYKYPYGKDGKVYRSALTAIRQRASQQNEPEIFDAAGELLKEVDKKSPVAASDKHPLYLVNSGISGVPNEIQLMPVGKFNGKKDWMTGAPQPCEVTEADVSQIVKNFNNVGRDLPIDYEHQSLTGVEAPAAGWITKLIDKGKEGLWAIVSWTDRAKSYLLAREYRFISPVWTAHGIDKESGNDIGAYLANAGLTNNPFFDGLKPIVASEKNYQTIFLTEESSTMNKVIAKLVSMYKLAADATEDQIIAKMDEHSQLVSGLVTARTEMFGLLGLQPTATIEEAKGLLIAAKTNSGSLATLTQELSTLKKSILDKDFDVVIAKAMQSGRVTAAQKNDAEWLGTQRGWAEKNFSSFSEYFTSKAPVIVPVGEITLGSSTATGAALNDTDMMVAKSMGVSKELLQKHNKAA